MSDFLGIKISELPETTDFNGLHTIGTDKNTKSVKVPLDFIKQAADYANAQGDYAKEAGDTVNGNAGVNDYPLFSASVTYSGGDIVRYKGVLYEFNGYHNGPWSGTDVRKTSINTLLHNDFNTLEAETLAGVREATSKVNSIEASVNSFKQETSTDIDAFKKAVTDQVNNYAPIIINGDVTNAPDEEDLTSVNGLLKLKNRSSLNGLGYVILRKDSISEIENLTNTIIEVRYDFDLEGDYVEIQEGCVLFFNGGSFINGLLIGKETRIIAPLVKIFGNITIGGTWCIGESYPEWFGAEANGIFDCADAIYNACNFSKGVRFSHGVYLVNKTIVLESCTSLYGGQSNNKYGDSIIKMGNNVDILIKCENDDAPYITLSDLHIIGANPVVDNAVFKSGTIAIDITSGNNTYINNCWIEGFEIILNSYHNSYYNRIKDCRFNDFKIAIKDVSPNNLVIENNRFSNFETAVRLGYGDGQSLITKNSFEKFSEYALYMSECNQVAFTYNYIEIWDDAPVPALIADNNNGCFGGNVVFYGKVKCFTAIGNEYQTQGAIRIYWLNEIKNFVSLNNHIVSYNGNGNVSYYTYFSGDLETFVCADAMDNRQLDQDKYADVPYLSEAQIPSRNTKLIIGQDPFSGNVYISTTASITISPNLNGGWWFNDSDQFTYARKIVNGYYLGGILRRRTDLNPTDNALVAVLDELNIPKRSGRKMRYKVMTTDFEDVVMEYDYNDKTLTIIQGSMNKDIYLDGIVIYGGV